MIIQKNNTIPSSLLPKRYQPISNSLISGGFGSVQAVKDTFLGRVVLFKAMHDSVNNTQLSNEITALSKARSRHIVEIYDVIKDQSNNIVGIIIERLKGRDFTNFHLEAQTSPDTFLRVLFQIATALADLHSNGIIHRDLKLDNFRESASGILKLFDFGLSVNGENYFTQNNRGTLIYAAPELFLKDAKITEQMDIYAMGVCAWALASQTFPLQMTEKPPQQSGPVPSLVNVMGKNLDIKIIDLLDSCLQHDPSKRPTAQTLASTIGQHLVMGRHRGLFIQANKEIFELSELHKNVRIKIGVLGELRAEYDGICFRITDVIGDVYVNNCDATAGMELHESCLLTFGAQPLGSARHWLTFFASHPEVVL